VLNENASSPYLSDGEGWEIPAPLNIPQVSSVEEDNSVITVIKSDSDHTQSKPANEFFVDETWELSVSHEEEIVSSHNQGGLKQEECVVREESDNMKTPVNTYELEHGVKYMDFGSYESALKASLMAFNKTGTVENTNTRIGSLESLLGPNFNVRPVDNGIFSVHTNQQQAETNLSLKNLLAGSIYHVGDENRGVTNDVTNTTILAESQVVTAMEADTHLMSQLVESDKTFRENVENETAANMLRTDISLKMEEQPKPGNCKQTETALPAEILTNSLPSMGTEPILTNSLPSMNSEPSVLMNVNDEVTSEDAHVLRLQSALKEETVPKRNLKLNLATLLGTDEIISTPVVLESLFKQDEPFDLVSYVFDEVSSLTSVLSI
jgi:hypothetical protein